MRPSSNFSTFCYGHRIIRTPSPNNSKGTPQRGYHHQTRWDKFFRGWPRHCRGPKSYFFGAGELTRDLFPVVNVVYIIDVYIVFYCCLHVCFPISFMLGVIILVRGVQPVSVSRRVSGIGVRLKVGDKYWEDWRGGVWWGALPSPVWGLGVASQKKKLIMQFWASFGTSFLYHSRKWGNYPPVLKAGDLSRPCPPPCSDAYEEGGWRPPNILGPPTCVHAVRNSNQLLQYDQTRCEADFFRRSTTNDVTRDLFVRILFQPWLAASTWTWSQNDSSGSRK